VRGTIWVGDDGEFLSIELHDPTGQALGEIADPRMRQTDVAKTLALALEWGQLEEIDWGAVSAAAIERWSPAGWRRIKRLAWSGRCWPAEDA